MFVGIDVSKDWVDVAVHPTGETWHVGLDEEAVDGLVRKLRDLAPQIVVMEARAGMSPSSARRSGRRASPPSLPTGLCALPGPDRIDAAVIARFGEASDVEARPPVPGNTWTPPAGHPYAYLGELRRRQALPAVRKSIEEVIAFLDLQLKEIDDDLGRLRESPLWQDQAKLLKRAGHGPVAPSLRRSEAGDPRPESGCGAGRRGAAKP